MRQRWVFSLEEAISIGLKLGSCEISSCENSAYGERFHRWSYFVGQVCGKLSHKLLACVMLLVCVFVPAGARRTLRLTLAPLAFSD